MGLRTFDYRSDTVTKPSPAMWERLRGLDNADIGDDVEGEDPTVNALEEKCAKLAGKEAGLFVTSGTQGNLVSLLAHTTPGEEILIEEHAHIYKWEVGGAARLGGLVMRSFPSQRGIFEPESLQPLIHYDADIHEVRSSLLALENTHNYHGGVILPINLFQKARKFADRNNLKIHVDGARIWNAVVAQNLTLADYAQYADSVQFCLSKGLSCPVGSMVVGSRDFIAKARKYRKMVGGGMRQAGIVAAFGLEALKPSWISRLREDHDKCARLAEGLEGIHPDVIVNRPDTNILMVEFPPSVDVYALAQKLAQNGVLMFDMGQKLRFVTHSGLSAGDVEESIPLIRQIIADHLR